MISSPAPTRERIVAAALRCIERWGLAKTSLEDVATAAQVSRATVYRHFPGGRDELIRETVTWEVGNFFTSLQAAVAEDDDVETKLVHALLVGHRAIHEHRLLQQILSTERDVFLAELAEISPMIFGEIANEMARSLEPEALRPGVDRTEAADYLARMFLSYLGSHGGADLTDPEATAQVVRTLFLGGICLPRP